MFGVILKATDSYFQKSVTFCRSIYVKKVNMKLLAFIFEQPSYVVPKNGTVQLMICNTPSVYETNVKVISIIKCIKMYTNVSCVYSVLLCCVFYATSSF